MLQSCVESRYIDISCCLPAKIPINSIHLVQRIVGVPSSHAGVSAITPQAYNKQQLAGTEADVAGGAGGAAMPVAAAVAGWSEGR